MYLIRCDDASEYMDIQKWLRVVELITNFGIVPLIGVIPKYEDSSFVNKYEYNCDFWNIARDWQERGCIMAMYGFNHVTKLTRGGLDPIHNRSEFVSLTLEQQKNKIKEGYNILKREKIDAKVFFALCYTFDENTLQALKEDTNIRIVSDTIANDVYKMDDSFFLPCQEGKCRSLPFKFGTIVLQPNEMKENDFAYLEQFLNANVNNCIKSFNDLLLQVRKFSFYDKILKFLYFSMRGIKKLKHRNKVIKTITIKNVIIVH